MGIWQDTPFLAVPGYHVHLNTVDDERPVSDGHFHTPAWIEEAYRESTLPQSVDESMLPSVGPGTSTAAMASDCGWWW